MPPAAEIKSDGKTVWVNGKDGACLGRFSWFGIDVHKDFKAQSVDGIQCLDCKKGPTTIEDWKRFQRGMLRYYKVTISDALIPKFLERKIT